MQSSVEIDAFRRSRWGNFPTITRARAREAGKCGNRFSEKYARARGQLTFVQRQRYSHEAGDGCDASLFGVGEEGGVINSRKSNPSPFNTRFVLFSRTLLSVTTYLGIFSVTVD